MNTSLTRTCIACGIEKPLSAFLQITGARGTTYGNICSACRSKGIPGKHSQAEEERTSTSSSMAIGAKQRAEITKAQENIQQEKQITEKEELKKEEKMLDEKTDARQEIEKAERIQRDTYKQKQSFLGFSPTRQTDVQQKTIHQKSNEQVHVKSTLASQEKHRALETANKVEAIKQELQRTTLDLSGAPLIDNPHNVISRDNPIIKQMQALLGMDAPMMKTIASRLYQQKKQTTETPKEFIRRTWGPASRK